MIRESWDSYWFRMAALIATRATCPRASIGAALVREKKLISSGFNGVASGEPHCPDTQEHQLLDHCPDAIHAEINALRNALVPVWGATLYVVGPRPVCPTCRDALERNGVTDIRWRETVDLAGPLDAVTAEYLTWARETFPGERTLEAAKHLVREAEELRDDPTNGEEHADVWMLAMFVADRVKQSAAVHGIDFVSEIVRKTAVNRARTWGEPDADGVVEHIREAVG